ncbi:MAG: FAD-binding protein [Proteobacteria bacterium]|nr:FAD-binding protein [Pseudomonadota bacterium]
MSDPSWDEEAEVVVLGGGGAGLRAALAAAEAGASTLLLEKMPALGGKTQMSIGIMTASGTSVQKCAGLKDSHARHLADIMAMGEKAGVTIDVPATKFMIQECSKEIDTLVGLGLEFSGPHPEGPHGMPRVHVIQPDCRRLVALLIEACEKSGARLETGVAGGDLILDHKGQIAGVQAGDKRIRAHAVVLAAGDYSANHAFVAQVAPKAGLAEPIRDFATGDGHRMAMRIGARTRNMQQVNTPHLRFKEWPFVEPSPGLINAGAVLVTGTGERVKTELGQSIELPDFEDRAADFYIVIDQATAENLAKSSDDHGPGRDGWALTGKPFIGTAPRVGYAYLEDCNAWDWHAETDSLEGAAKQIGCTATSLRTAMGSTPNGALHILGPMRRVLANSGGGLSTNQRMNVLSEDGPPIRGLYGAGVNARLISFMGGHGYALAWAMASGRIAGQQAATYSKKI